MSQNFSLYFDINTAFSVPSFSSGAALVYKCSFSPPYGQRIIEHGGIETNGLSMTPMGHMTNCDSLTHHDLWLTMTQMTHFDSYDSSTTKISKYPSDWVAWYIINSWCIWDTVRHMGHVSIGSYGAFIWNDYERSYEHLGIHSLSLSIIAAGNH